MTLPFLFVAQNNNRKEEAVVTGSPILRMKFRPHGPFLVETGGKNRVRSFC